MWTVLLAPAQPAGNQPPTADFDVSCTGLECDFNDTGSVDPDGTIATWAWDFGDGATATEADPTHTFGSAGSYQVTLTVTDNNDATDTHTQTVTVPPAEVVTVTGAGDIASCNGNQPAPGAVATGRLLDSVVAEKPDATVIAIGDLAYDEGTPQQFACAYHPTWGRHYNRTKAGGGQPRVPHPGCRRVLRLLERPGRRPRRRVVQLRPRFLARGGPQHQLHRDRRLRAGVSPL